MLYGDLAAHGADVYNLPFDVYARDIGARFTRVGDDFVIAIPGTRGFVNWLTDLNWLPDLFVPIGPYHSGFGADIVALAPLVRDAIPAGVRPVLVGHSLGGAVAQGVAACLALWGYKPAVLTMGAPRGPVRGNIWFSHLISKCSATVAFERRGDVVPNTPGPILFKHPVAGIPLGEAIDTLDPSINHAVARYVTDIRAAYPTSEI